MSARENKGLVRRFYEDVWDRGNVDVCDDVFAPDYIRHDLRPSREPGRYHDREAPGRQFSGGPDPSRD